MMEVNAFWFGFLIAIVVLLVLTIILAMVTGRRREDETEEIEVDQEEYRKALETMTGRKIRVYRDRNGFLVGEAIEDPDDDESD